ncbi:MAG: lipopolysaccharide biosynthesis protein [Bacteroidia bacterium]
MGSIKKQGITNTIVSYIGICIGFLNLIVLQPIMLKPEELGLTRIMFSFTIIAGTLFPLGLNFLTVKFFPRFKNKENGHNGYFGLLMLLALIGYLILSACIYFCKELICAKYSNSPLFIEYFNYVFPITFCIGFITIITGYCNALFKSSVPTFLNDVYLRIFTTIIVCLYFAKLISFDVFIFLYAGSYMTQLTFLLIYVRYIKAFSLKINFAFFRSQHLPEIIKYTALLALASLASIGIRNVDVMLVGSYLNLDAVAVYTLGMTIGSLIEIPVNSLSRIADSKISDAIQRNDMRMVGDVYTKSVKYMTLIGGLLFVLLYANIAEGLTFLPEKYHSAKWVVLIIGFSAFTNMATGVNTSIIYFSHKYVTGTYLLFAMIVVSLILNVVLIPHYGIEGSAMATAVALILYNIAKFLLIKKHFDLQPYDGSIVKLFLIIALCVGVAIILPDLSNKIVSIALKTVVLLSLFMLLIFKLKVISADEVRNMKQL